MADANNAFEKVGGKIKEGLGKVTGNESMENEGKADQTKADVKDKFNDAGNAVKDKTNEALGSVQDHKDNR